MPSNRTRTRTLRAVPRMLATWRASPEEWLEASPTVAVLLEIVEAQRGALIACRNRCVNCRTDAPRAIERDGRWIHIMNERTTQACDAPGAAAALALTDPEESDAT